MLVGDFNPKLVKGLIKGDVHAIGANGKNFKLFSNLLMW